MANNGFSPDLPIEIRQGTARMIYASRGEEHIPRTLYSEKKDAIFYLTKAVIIDR